MADLKKLQKDAQRHLRRGSAADAFRLYLELLAETDAPASLYDSWVSEAERLAQQLSDPRLAAYLALYRRDIAAARLRLPPDRFALELGHAVALAAELTSSPSAQAPAVSARRLFREAVRALHAEAAALFEAARRPVLAASAYAAASDPQAAIRCYHTLLHDGTGSSSEASAGGRAPLGPYEQALVHFQLALLMSEPPGQREGQRHSAAAQQLLEAVADAHETAGEIDRALDCYRLYIHLGRALGRFENIVEGSVSTLRLLREERRTLDLLRAYEELLDACAEQREFHLAAGQCREAADLLTRLGLPWASLYRRKAGEALLRAASDNIQRGGPAQLSESALLQAIAAFNALGDFEAVRLAFEQLAGLALPEPSRQRYHRLSQRYSVARLPEPTEPPPPLPAALRPSARQSAPLPPIWELDLLEWQAAGDPAEVCLGLLCSLKSPQLTRRSALRLLLHAASEKPADDAAALAEQQRKSVEALGGLRCYEALRPLERLYGEQSASGSSAGPGPKPAQGAARLDAGNPTPAARLRRAIVESLPRLPFRRALVLITRGLADPDLGVYAASLEALARSSYPEAVSGLIRLYRSQPELAIRRAILTALGHSHDPRAYELLLEVLCHEPEPTRGDALRLLFGEMAEAGPILRPFVERLATISTGKAAVALRGLLQNDLETGSTRPG